jgi:tetratricopeptide (TPR) repeat protein
MSELNINHFLQITERIKIKSHGAASYENDDEPSWTDVMQTGRQCRIYGLYTDAIWCYDQAMGLTDYLDIEIEKQKELKSYVHSAKAMCLSTMGNNTEAITECEKAFLLFPKNYEAFCNKGIALNNLGKYKESIAAHKKAVEINPEFPNSWNAIGHIMVDQEKDYQNAIPFLIKRLNFPMVWTLKLGLIRAMHFPI